MSREFIRRSCGHGEAVYVIGPACGRHRRIRAKESELCGICRNRRAGDADGRAVVTVREDEENASLEGESLRHVLKNVLKERGQSNNTKKGENS